MQSLNDRMAGCTVFTKIDLVKAYHQILIAEADIPKTAIATPVGLWEFLLMAFGTRNAAQAIQRLKDNILMGLDYVFSFLDDDGVFSKSRGRHWTHLRTLFAIFSKKLSKTDVNYSTFDQELLTAMSGIKHFRLRLEGRPFWLWTDHKSLIFALNRASTPTCGRQQQHLGFISEYTNQFVYVRGT
jgi:hypothetical protein